MSAKLTKAQAGAIGAERRWGPRRIVRLDALDPRVAAAVRALVDADAAVREPKPAASEAA